MRETRRGRDGCPVQAVFCFIGAAPHTEWLKGMLQLDRVRAIVLAGPDLSRDGHGKRPAGWPLPRDPFWLETSVAGIFAVGDMRLHSIKRMASAIGEGSMSISFVHLHLRSPEIALAAPARRGGIDEPTRAPQAAPLPSCSARIPMFAELSATRTRRPSAARRGA